MICPSPPLRALSRPTPPLARLKGRALVGRGFIFQMRFAHGLATKKEGGEIALSFSTTQKLQILALERFCGVGRVPPQSNTGKRHHGRFAGRGGRTRRLKDRFDTLAPDHIQQSEGWPARMLRAAPLCVCEAAATRRQRGLAKRRGRRSGIL
jgi:hypothetical protein